MSAGLALAAAFLLLSGLAAPRHDDPDYVDSGARIFRADEVATVEVVLPPAALDSMLADPWVGGYRRCSVRFANSRVDTVIQDVGIRPRGNSSLFALKLSWKLSFNAFVPGRQFHGVEKLNLNGEHNDVSIIRSRLASELYRSQGVPAARATHARLRINDGQEVDGLFVQVEQIDEEFAEAWFDDKAGSLYKCAYLGARADLRWVAPGDGAAYAALGGGETYAEKNLDAPDHADLADFIAFVNLGDDALFAAELAQRFSLDNFLRAMAVDVAIGHWDDYWYGANNYYLYANGDTGRFEYVPYDLDNTYGVDFLTTNWAERPLDGWGDGGIGSDGGLPPLMDRILAHPPFRAQLTRYVRASAAGPFALAASEARIDAIRDLIADHAFTGSFANGNMDWGYTHADFLASYDEPEDYRAWESGWDYGLKPYIADRADWLLTHVPTPPPLPALRINELQASNASTIADDWGEYDDWVEILNADSAAVQLGGMSLSDRWGEPRRFQLPDTLLQPGARLLVWCDGSPEQGPLHAAFRLDADGERLGLFHRAEYACAPLDTVSFGPQVTDRSYGRNPDGGGTWQIFASPTPGEANLAPWQGPAGGLALRGAWPNPTRGAVRIAFSLAADGPLRLRIFDVRGREVARIDGGSLPAGRHELAWDGRNTGGRALPAGVYPYRLRSGRGEAAGKLMLLR